MICQRPQRRVCRLLKWNIPFWSGRGGNRERVMNMYEIGTRRRYDLIVALPKLAGKRLGCYRYGRLF